MEIQSRGVYSNKDMDMSDISRHYSVESSLKQAIGIKCIPYKHVLNPLSRILSDKKIKEMSERMVYFSDEGLAHYYNNSHCQQMKSFFVQRIQDSNSFILLFPTGLLLHIQLTTM